MNFNIVSWMHAAFVPSSSSRSVEARAIYFAGGMAGISLVLSVVLFLVAEQGGVRIFGAGSLGTVAIMLATIAAAIGYFYAANQTQIEKIGRVHMTWKTYLGTASLAFVHAAITMLLTAIVFFIVSDAFTGLVLDGYISSVLVATTVAVTSYIVYLVGVGVSTVMIANALAVFLVAGVLVSMITADDPYWWTQHLSSLGAGSGVSAFAFEMTLVMGGAVVACLAGYLSRDFQRLQSLDALFTDTKIRTVQTLLALIGLFLAFVGYFPYDTYPAIHDNSASGMVVLFLALILGLRFLVPGMSRAFVMFSYALMAVLIACLVLYVIGYFNLTAFEIASFAIVFSWLVVFIRQVAAALMDARLKRHTKAA